MRSLAPVFLLLLASAATFHYSVPQSFFVHEDPNINANPASYTSHPDFGLLNQTYSTDALFDPSGQKTQWELFTQYVNALNSASDADTHYKVLYMARHGEAVHNIAQTHYGSQCWECYWSQQPGNGTATWQDAELTVKGHSQVEAAREFWSKGLAVSKFAVPQSFYVSPMARTLITVNETWSTQGIWSEGKRFAPTVKELLRETLNACTCSWRHPKSWIQQRFPSYKFEPGFSEDDTLWRAGIVSEGQGSPAQLKRVRALLDDVFSRDTNTFISFTTHGVVINPILAIITHPNPSYNITTGGAIPILIKAVKVSEGVTESDGKVESPFAAKSCGVC